MKILHLLPLLKVPPDGHGGTERMVYNLAKEQAKAGHEVTLLAAGTSKVPGVKITTYPSRKKDLKNPLLDWIYHQSNAAKQIIKAYLYADDNQFDIVHGYYSEVGTGFSFLKRTANITTHCGTMITQILPYTLLHIASLTTRGKVVAISKCEYQTMKPFWNENLVGYVHLGFPMNELTYTENPIREHEIELAFLARIAPFKGTHLAVKVFDILCDNGYDVRLRIMGGVYSRYQEYGHHITRLAQERKNVTFSPNVGDDFVENVISSSDTMLFPYLWPEPFSMGIVEAASRGTPSIAFNLGSAPEIIKHGKTGFLCNNAEEAAQYVTQIKEIKREDVRKHVESNFSSKSMYEKYMEIYNQII